MDRPLARGQVRPGTSPTVRQPLQLLPTLRVTRWAALVAVAALNMARLQRWLGRTGDAELLQLLLVRGPLGRCRGGIVDRVGQHLDRVRLHALAHCVVPPRALRSGLGGTSFTLRRGEIPLR